MINKDKKNYHVFKHITILATVLFSAYATGAEKTISFDKHTPRFRPTLSRLQQPQASRIAPQQAQLLQVSRAPDTSGRVAAIRLSNIENVADNPEANRQPRYSHFTTLIVIVDTGRTLTSEEHQALFRIFSNLREVLYVPKTDYDQLLQEAGGNKDLLAQHIRTNTKNK